MLVDDLLINFKKSAQESDFTNTLRLFFELSSLVPLKILASISANLLAKFIPNLTMSGLPTRDMNPSKIAADFIDHFLKKNLRKVPFSYSSTFPFSPVSNRDFCMGVTYLMDCERPDISRVWKLTSYCSSIIQFIHAKSYFHIEQFDILLILAAEIQLGNLSMSFWPKSVSIYEDYVKTNLQNHPQYIYARTEGWKIVANEFLLWTTEVGICSEIEDLDAIFKEWLIRDCTPIYDSESSSL